MNFDKQDKGSKFTKALAYFVMYCVFTTMLFFLFKILGKTPSGWKIYHFIGITLALVLFGRLLKLTLK